MKTHGERIARVEAWHVAHAETCEGHFKEIKERLTKLNGDVAENSKFRLQQKTVYGVLMFAWVSVLVPLAVIAVAVLT